MPIKNHHALNPLCGHAWLPSACCSWSVTAQGGAAVWGGAGLRAPREGGAACTAGVAGPFLQCPAEVAETVTHAAQVALVFATTATTAI